MKIPSGYDIIDDFKTGFKSYAVDFFGPNTLGQPNAIYLIRHNKTALELRSTMTDIGDRLEIGSIIIKNNTLDSKSIKIEKLPSKWCKPLLVSKLVIHDNVNNKNIFSESGLRIRNSYGEKIDIVSAAYPFNIEMSAPFVKFKFSPEYSIEDYSEVPF